LTAKIIQKVRYEEMLPHEVVEAREKCPVAYLPIGGIEWHGEHNCLGLDTIKIHGLAMKCAESGGGVVFPALFYGEPREHYLMEANHDPDGRILSTMKIPSENFRSGYMQETQIEEDMNYVRLLIKILRQMRSLEFRVITIMAGHYPLLRHAQAAVELSRLQMGAGVRVWATSGYDLVKNELPDVGDHAAAWETSLMMYLRSELVDLRRLPEDPQESLIGVLGRDPRQHASREFGQRGTEMIVRKTTARVHELLSEISV
jgi:creatinine amidohydrolase